MLELFTDMQDCKASDQAHFSTPTQDDSSDNESQLSSQRKISIKVLEQHHTKEALLTIKIT